MTQSESDARIADTYRWLVTFFFALAAVPFISVWLVTQGPKTLDKMSPTYSVVAVSEIRDTDWGLSFKNVTFKQNRDCDPAGLIYLSGSYVEGTARASEVLMLADQAVKGNDFIIGKLNRGGQTFVIPEMRVLVSKGLLAQMNNFHFMIPCRLFGMASINAYTNAFVIN